jgi:hypothetical protein
MRHVRTLREVARAASRMRRVRARAFAAGALLLLAASAEPASAQFDLTYPDPIQFAQPGASHFLAGFIDHPGASITVQPDDQNDPWLLRLRAKDPDLRGYGKPLSHVLWRVGSSGSWIPLTGSFVTIASGTGTQTVVVYFRILLYWNLDVPDEYETTVAIRVQH